MSSVGASMNVMIASAESPYYADAMYARELKARRDRMDERRRRDLDRQKQKQALRSGAGLLPSAAVVAAPTAAPTTATAIATAASWDGGADGVATQQLERLFRTAEKHTQRESEARLELQRKQELKEAIANRKAAAKTFSIVRHRHPRELDQDHIALLKKRFRSDSFPAGRSFS